MRILAPGDMLSNSASPIRSDRDETAGTTDRVHVGALRDLAVTARTMETRRTVAKSKILAKTASALMPGGLLPAFSGWHGQHYTPMLTSPPPVFIKGKDATLTDVDGNKYIDYAGAHGTLILGHADERVVAAIGKAASKGCGFGAPSETEVRLVELIVGRFPSIDMLRLVDTPADALRSAIALAHQTTGRDWIVTFDGYALHSTVYGPPFQDSGESLSPLTPPYNNIEAVERLFREQGATIAAVVVEPPGVSTGLIQPARGLLKALRALCDTHGALLVFDETLTGVRIASGGATTLYGVSPDLILLGPIIGGGLPIAAFGGCKEVMKLADMNNSVEVSSPMRRLISPASGNLLAMAAGIVTLQALGEPGFYEALEEKAARLDEGLRAAAAAAGIPMQLTRVASILGMVFSNERIVHGASTRRCDTARFAGYHQVMLDHGVLLPPSPLSCIFVSAAHTDEEIDRTIEAAHEALRIVGEEEVLNGK